MFFQLQVIFRSALLLPLAFLGGLLFVNPAHSLNLVAEQKVANQIVKSGLSSMHFWTKEQNAVQSETGIGLFYGVNSVFSLMQPESRNEHLQRKKKPGTYPEEPQPIACIFWVFKHLGNAYAQAGQKKRWEEIEKTVRSKDSDGVFLMQELQKDGWEAVYWNFDVENPVAEAAHHEYYAKQVGKTGIYQGINIQHKLLNFRVNQNGNTILDTSGLAKLSRVPFWVGIANGAYHVFLGYQDRINEAHSTFNPEVSKNIQDRPLAEWGLDSPVKYLSGVIMIPPGSWN